MLAIPVYLGLVLTALIVVFYFERKIPAFIQDRLGPMEAGKYGVLQALADVLKLIQKEDIVPTAADRILFLAAPFIIFLAVFAGFSVLPLNASFVGSSLYAGVFFIMTIISVDVMGLLMAGWGSNSKFSLFGAMRSVAQIISYEIPFGISVLCAVVISQTLDLQEMSYQQGVFINSYAQGSDEMNYLFGIKALGIDVTDIGGILTWNIVRMPFLFIAYVIFFIATLAECNRAPFDLPEAESEIIGGYHTEYSGFRFAIFFLAEYGMMLLVSLLGAILFLGAWNSPLPNIGSLRLAEWTTGAPGTVSNYILGSFWIVLKAFLAMLVHVWVRWTYPRLRVDQLMHLCWKVLTPIGIFILLLSCIWRLLMV
jgi:NADH-quinone oxidoreductase subunit H